MHSLVHKIYTRFLKTILLAVLFTLAGCGGGGGGGAAPPVANQPPVAQNSCPTILDSNSSATVNLVATDPEGSTLTYTIASSPANGSVSPPSNTTGVFTYTPIIASPLRGMDRFTFTVTDSGGLTSAPATVTILNNGAVRIMPLGDSLTSGTGDPNGAGYRRRLYQELETQVGAGRINFVGSQTTGLQVDFDRNHEGHGGWCDDNVPCGGGAFGNIRDSINGFLNTNPADILLLHIGTNDFEENDAGVNSILNNINTWATNNYPLYVFVARIIPSRDGTLVSVTTFNNNVELIDNNRSKTTVFNVNQQTGAGIHNISDATGNTGNPAFYADNLHLNPSGYNLMADKWKADMTSAGVLPTCP